ncbi:MULTISPECIES: hypothetical protein [unclassified Sphingopyxis]|uniref:hypothetical protein n=1 Tax=unclassified Sphingopyxis TaxID=2614943 RepID=UPI0024AD5552|nr:MULTISPECIES: hypothetical protein [unclassified Sphingopyxis]
MDLNHLLDHYQMALIAVSRARRNGHLLPNFDLPSHYTKRIAEYRDPRGLKDGLPIRTQPGSVRPRADPATSEPVTGYGDFLVDTLIAELLIQKGFSMKPQERRASALEDIGGRLADIEEALRVIGRDIYRSLGYDDIALSTLADDTMLDDNVSTTSTVKRGSERPSTDEGISRSHAGQLPPETSQNTNVHDDRAELLRQRIRERSLSEQADDPDCEQIISRAMLDAENRHGTASEQFAVGKEVEAARLGDRAAAHIWKIVAERLHKLHDIGGPLEAGLMNRLCAAAKATS